MKKWLIKTEKYTFDYNVSNLVEGQYSNEFHNLMAKEGQQGWEPWHISGFVSNMIEHVVVWFKREE